MSSTVTSIVSLTRWMLTRPGELSLCRRAADPQFRIADDDKASVPRLDVFRRKCRAKFRNQRSKSRCRQPDQNETGVLSRRKHAGVAESNVLRDENPAFRLSGIPHI